jgi:aryl-alcohol dehydrogenase-like predicted oxidoreductase
MVPHGSLGRTGLSVSRLGIGASYGVGERDICWAVDQGVNVLYWGSLRRSRFGDGIRSAAAAHGRDRVVVVVQSYTRIPGTMGLSVSSALRKLRFDYADVLLLGWWNSAPWESIVEAAQRIKEKGLARYIMISGHDRPTLAKMATSGSFDALMVRYNAAHRGAETELFATLGSDRPGIVAYTATRWGTLLKKAPSPADHEPLCAEECYRFSLSHPCVDLVLCGPRNGAELKDAVRAAERGPLDDEALRRARAVGDGVHAVYRDRRFRWPFARAARSGST